MWKRLRFPRRTPCLVSYILLPSEQRCAALHGDCFPNVPPADPQGLEPLHSSCRGQPPARAAWSPSVNRGTLHCRHKPHGQGSEAVSLTQASDLPPSLRQLLSNFGSVAHLGSLLKFLGHEHGRGWGCREHVTRSDRSVRSPMDSDRRTVCPLLKQRTRGGSSNFRYAWLSRDHPAPRDSPASGVPWWQAAVCLNPHLWYFSIDF